MSLWPNPQADVSIAERRLGIYFLLQRCVFFIAGERSAGNPVALWNQLQYEATRYCLA